jgi:hypothetical protein
METPCLKPSIKQDGVTFRAIRFLDFFHRPVFRKAKAASSTESCRAVFSVRSKICISEVTDSIPDFFIGWLFLFKLTEYQGNRQQLPYCKFRVFPSFKICFICHSKQKLDCPLLLITIKYGASEIFYFCEIRWSRMMYSEVPIFKYTINSLLIIIIITIINFSFFMCVFFLCSYTESVIIIMAVVPAHKK